MAVNFCDERLGTKVSSPQVCADGHKVSNLIDGYKTQKAKNVSFLKNSNEVNVGFRVEYFIKPPVEILFDFKDSIDIHSIRLNCFNSHVIEAIQLHGIALNHTYGEKIGETYSNKNEVMLFTNPMYRTRSPFHDQPSPAAMLNSPKSIPLKGQKLLCNLKCIRLRILRMNASGVAGLKSVCIYGQLARSKNKEETDRRSLHIKQILFGKPDEKISPENRTGTEKTPDNVHNGDIEIPKDFLDAITFEVMALPMLLPSGQSVDKYTLEKLAQSDSSACRPPSDPFTGIPFTTNCKPVNHSSLKVRIDAFLTQNSLAPNLISVARTLGKNEEISDFLCADRRKELARKINLEQNHSSEKRAVNLGESSTNNSHRRILKPMYLPQAKKKKV